MKSNRSRTGRKKIDYLMFKSPCSGNYMFYSPTIIVTAAIFVVVFVVSVVFTVANLILCGFSTK